MLHIETIDRPDGDLREKMYSMFRQYNHAVNPEYWRKRDDSTNEPQPLNLFAFDETGAAIGAIFADTQFSWLRLDVMIVHESWRKKGVGSALLAKAEELAKARDCRYVYVDTMENQAPGFYEKFGYAVAGKLDDWDSHGNAKYYFVKKLE
ncbi:MAG: N-acetyltransferase [Candidatus Hydrogenedentota bacterium]